jgi:hypothetical protein
MDWDQVTLKRNRLSAAPGYGGWDSFETFSAGQQKEYEAWYNQNYQQEKEVPQETITWKAPENYNTNVDHHLAWYAGIREGKPIVEDALFGMRAAGPALLANKSIMEKKIIHWDPTGAKLA